MSSFFKEELKTIREKFLLAGFPPKFVDSVIGNFINPRPADIDEDLPLIPPYFFDSPPPFILIELPFCTENERLSKYFIRKIKSFLGIECTVVIKWATKKIRSLFSLKSRNPHPACKIYQGVCSCGSTYIGETKRNVELRWSEQNSPMGNSEPAKHLSNNPTHSFTWNVILNAPLNARKNTFSGTGNFLRGY